MPSGFNLPKQYDSIKIYNDGQKKREKKTQETESEDQLPRVRSGVSPDLI